MLVFPFYYPPPRASPATNDRKTPRHTPPVQPRPSPTLLLLPGDGISATIANGSGGGSHSDCASNTSIVLATSLAQTRQDSVRNGVTSN
ncbi:hypothetical protein C8R43DRAFT_1133113 [Mycena crocata]|nr:hypothetical protein C8R43DRAFT_1133113 [Mycena crocata]